MKKCCCFVFLTVLLFFLISCERNQEDTDYLPRNDIRKSVDITYYELPEEPTEESFVPSSVAVPVEIKLWEPYKGSLPKADLQKLETLATMAENGNIFFRGSYYEELIVPEDKYVFSCTSGWRIDLDRLSVLGKTETNEVILAHELSSPTLLCTIDTLGNVTIYFREDFAAGGLEAIDFSEFIIINEGTKPTDRTFIEQVWKNHVQKPTDLRGTVWADGDVIYYKITLKHSAEPAMQYELNFGICGDELYLKNQYVRFNHVVPMKDLLIDSE